jgi:hypothetical protein
LLLAAAPGAMCACARTRCVVVPRRSQHPGSRGVGVPAASPRPPCGSSAHQPGYIEPL